MAAINHPIKNNFQNKQQNLLESEGRFGEREPPLTVPYLQV